MYNSVVALSRCGGGGGGRAEDTQGVVQKEYDRQIRSPYRVPPAMSPFSHYLRLCSKYPPDSASRRFFTAAAAAAKTSRTLSDGVWRDRLCSSSLMRRLLFLECVRLLAAVFLLCSCDRGSLNLLFGRYFRLSVEVRRFPMQSHFRSTTQIF